MRADKQLIYFSYTGAATRNTTAQNAVDLPPGVWRISLALSTVGSANNTVTYSLDAYVDAAQTVVGTAPLGLVTVGKAGSGIATGSVAHAPAATAYDLANVSFSLATSQLEGSVLPYGVRLNVVISDTGATAGTWAVKIMCVEV